MPTRPPRLCSRCGTRFSDPRCPRCRPVVQKEKDHARGSSSSRLYDWRWRKAALAFLRDNPLCYYCGKRHRITAAKHVDHATPHKGNLDLFWDRSNWRSACAHCNSVKGDKTETQFLAVSQVVAGQRHG